MDERFEKLNEVVTAMAEVCPRFGWEASKVVQSEKQPVASLMMRPKRTDEWCYCVTVRTEKIGESPVNIVSEFAVLGWDDPVARNEWPGVIVHRERLERFLGIANKAVVAALRLASECMNYMADALTANEVEDPGAEAATGPAFAMVRAMVGQPPPCDGAKRGLGPAETSAKR